MKHNIKHIFFDLDHTLWDFDKNSGLTFQKIFKQNAIDVHIIDFLKVYEPINLGYWKLYREERITKSELRYGRLKSTFNKLNIKISDDMIHYLSEVYIENLSTFNHLFDGTIEILEYLKNQYQLHIITNGFEETQDKKMKTSNIIHYFKTLTNSETVGVKKPNPKIFNFALNTANAKANESIMIGDNFEADIKGAIKVGMNAIHFDYKNQYQNYNHTKITHLKTLINIL